jgi:hypothetical protein
MGGIMAKLILTGLSKLFVLQFEFLTRQFMISIRTQARPSLVRYYDSLRVALSFMRLLTTVPP